jgi:hypothetical protein
MPGGNNILSPANIFELENEVINDLTNFNKLYSAYFRCASVTSTSVRDSVSYPCSDADKAVTQQQVNDAYAKLSSTTTTPQGSIVRLNAAISAMGTTGGTTPSQYVENYNAIMRSYSEIIKKRQQLDAGLAELYEIGDTKNNFYQRQLMATSYGKILLTIIASSITVGIFLTLKKQ